MITPQHYDWTRFVPETIAVLCFLRDRDRVLLIRKKRGLGAGKINAPGGKCEPGEPPHTAAIREMEEEVGVRPSDLRNHGVLRFAFTDGYTLKVYVFLAYAGVGTLRETEEADPFWTTTDALPFDEMWEDDRHWLPHVLSGERVEAEMLFHHDAMIEWNIRFSGGTRLVGAVAHPSGGDSV